MIKRASFQKVFVALTLAFCFCAGAFAGEDEQNQESRFLKNVRQLIYEGKRSGEGYFSPDGKALIFQSEREATNPFCQIYLLDLETGDTHRVSTGKGKTTCAFFRPGRDEVLFSSSHLDPETEAVQNDELARRTSGKQRRYSWDYDIHMEIFSAQRDGSNLKRLTSSPGYDAEASFSPDGSKIVFCSLRDAYAGSPLSDAEEERLKIDPSYFGEIYIMNADGSGQKRLTHSPGYDGGPFFSPDGERIIWRRFEENGAIADVFTMSLDGTDVRKLTSFAAMSWAPFYHPSGKYVAFASNKLGFSNFEIYLTDALGQHEPVRVTYTDGFDGLPVFSPDGTRLAWTTNRTADKKSQIFIAAWNHEAALAELAASPRRVTELESGAAEAELKGARKTEAVAGSLSPEIRAADLTEMVSYLAADSLEGRMSGTSGTTKAARYIARRFTEAGLQPAGDAGSFYHQFEFTSGIKMREDANRLSISAAEDETVSYRADTDFRPLPFSTDGKVEGEVVFAGYGLSVPGDTGQGAESYGNLDVTDKIVLVLRYIPEQVDMERRQELNHYAGLRYKALIAREHGAKAILIVSGPNSSRAGQLVPLSFDNSSSNSGIIAASISGAVAESLFRAVGKSLQEVQDQLDLENPHFEGQFGIPNLRVSLETGLERVKKSDRNVVGVLRATSAEERDALILGAHYDHIGYGEIGSLAHKGEEGQIHNGADDNASGTSVVLELAASLSHLRNEKPDLFKRDILFALWSGEELGLIGSSAFAADPPVSLTKAIAYLNFDMVGRLREDRLILQGTGSSSIWPKLIEKRNVAAGFNLVIQNDPYQPTDVTAFYPKGVPVLGFFTGSHEDYNRPTDDAGTLNYAGMERIAKFAQGIVLDLLENEVSPDYLKVERVRSASGNRESMRAYLGTIPDYAGAETGGVKLSGVSGGGPADIAGLKSGDVIVELAGQEIQNIYDYTYAIDALKIGEGAKVVVKRGDERVELTIVPEARE